MKQCESYTIKGTRCTHLIADDKKYCFVHVKKALPKPAIKKCLGLHGQSCDRQADPLKSYCATCHGGKRWLYYISGDEIVFTNVASGESVNMPLADIARILAAKAKAEGPLASYSKFQLFRQDIRHIVKTYNAKHPESRLEYDDRFGIFEDKVKAAEASAAEPDILKTHNITTREEFMSWIKANHPDRFPQASEAEKARLNQIFAEIYSAGKARFTN